MKPPVEAQLTWPQVHAFRLQRHHLAARAPKKDLAQAVGDIGGAQAQVMSAAELQIAARVECSVEDVRKALWTDRALVKTWLMRGTLHLARSDDLPIYTAALSKRYIRISNSWLKFWKVTEAEIWKLVDSIGDAVNGEPMSREELIAIVGKGKTKEMHDALRSGWGGMLKPAARNGRLCFGPNRGQSVTFVSPKKWLHSWREIDPADGITEMARRYLGAYGPATKYDFARWWGPWPGVGNAAWSGLAGELTPVSIDGGVRAYVLTADLNTIRKARLERSVVLLPNFDPYLMGYANRDHLFEKVHRPKVSRTAGWISAVVLVDGRVEGTWTYTMNKGVLRVKVEPFKPLAAKVVKEVRNRAGEIAVALGASKAEVG